MPVVTDIDGSRNLTLNHFRVARHSGRNIIAPRSIGKDSQPPNASTLVIS